MGRKKKPAQSRKRHLVFYSGGPEKENVLLHKALANLKGRRVRSFTYVPCSHENGLYYFNRIKKQYRKFGFRKFRYFAADSDFLVREMRDALKSDVIYLAGGNTFYFLKHIQDSGFMERLRRFVRRGGILAGLSAGAIIMTPHIVLAGYPPHEGDENEVRLKDLRALGLVQFEFLPHFSNSAKTNAAMLKYSRKSKYPVVACPDGSGVVVNGEGLHFWGKAYLYYGGRKFRLN